MRILFSIRNISYGGACKQIAMTANAMTRRGHEVAIVVYCSNDIQQQLDTRIVCYTHAEERSKLKEYLFAPLRIRKAIRSFKPDVVVSWRANAGCMTVIAAIGTGVRVVFSERTDPYMETNPMLKVATKIADRSDGGVFQTTMARDFYKHIAGKSVVIPNPVTECANLPDVVPMGDRRKEIVCVGRFSLAQKRQDIMVKAFQIIHSQMPDIKLSFYGDGDGLANIRLMVEEMNLTDYVLFHGSVKGIVDHIRTARLLVLTSDYEGIPNTLIEAHQAGVPIVTTDCSPGGARVVVEDGVSGYIVPIRDCRALASKAIELIRDDAKSLAFIKNGRVKLKEFEPEKLFDMWEKYLTSISGMDEMKE